MLLLQVDLMLLMPLLVGVEGIGGKHLVVAPVLLPLC